MLPNERFALERRAYYDSIGLVVDATNGEFAHCPLTRKECDTGYYLLHNDHQHHGLLQSKDLGKCCFFPADAKRWLENCEPFPDGYLDLWGIYEEFSSLLGKRASEKAHCEKDELGRSTVGVKNAYRLHVERDEFGRSVHGLISAERLHKEKNLEGKSINAVKGAQSVHAEKDESGRSRHGVKAAERLHREKDDQGRSLNALKAHGKKDDLGRSIAAVKAAKKRQRGVKLTRIKDGEVFIFESIIFAAEVLNLRAPNICGACKGKLKTVSGYTAEYWDG